MKLTNLLEKDSAIITKCDDLGLLKHGLVKNTEIIIYSKRKYTTCIYLRGAILACRNKDLEDVKAYKIN